MRAMDLEMVPRQRCGLTGALAPVIAAGIVTGSVWLKRVEIACDGSMAWATIADNKQTWRLLFVDDKKARRSIEADPAIYDAYGATYAGHWFILTGAVIDQIKLGMTDTPAGYAEVGKRSSGRPNNKAGKTPA
jgi:hypothetical protein